MNESLRRFILPETTYGVITDFFWRKRLFGLIDTLRALLVFRLLRDYVSIVDGATRRPSYLGERLFVLSWLATLTERNFRDAIYASTLF